jgi:hypothetical protein
MSNINYASELRIGNIVSFPIEKSGENSYYENSVIVKLSFLYASAFILNGDSKKDYETPIPKIIPTQLTEGWLLEFGFFKFNNAYILKKPEESSINFQFSVWQDMTYNSSEFNIKLNYVHQLQNLFFALTGNELQLSNY